MIPGLYVARALRLRMMILFEYFDSPFGRNDKLILATLA